MIGFQRVNSKVVPLPHANVDTDQIIPARYLKVTDKVGLGSVLFADWRFNEDGSPDQAFILNQAHVQGAQVLLTKENFGCGSSREHAPWALVGWGLKAVIAPSFADIFKNNAFKNGLLSVELAEDQVDELFDLVDEIPQVEIKIDLAAQKVHLPVGKSFDFEMDPFAKRCLLEGVDILGYLLALEPEISAYESRQGGA